MRDFPTTRFHGPIPTHAEAIPPPHRTPASWEATFMAVARSIAGRSKDASTQCGALIVSPENRILGSGFNGPPPQFDDARVPWNDRPAKYGYIIHSEENAILDALDKNPSERLRYSVCYVTSHPCSGCLLRLIRAGVERVIWDADGPPARMLTDAVVRECAELIARLKMSVRFELVPYSGGA